MRLWIANVTRQRFVIWWRLDGGQTDGRFTAPRQTSIDPNTQVQIGGDMELPQIQTLLDQLEPFGLVGEKDVANGLSNRTHEIVFNIDRQVSPRAIETLKRHNLAVKMKEGERRREAAAIGANEALKNTISDSELPPPPQFDVEIEQMEQFQDEKRVEEGFHVKQRLDEVPAEVFSERRRA